MAYSTHSAMVGSFVGLLLVMMMMGGGTSAASSSSSSTIKRLIGATSKRRSEGRRHSSGHCFFRSCGFVDSSSSSRILSHYSRAATNIYEPRRAIFHTRRNSKITTMFSTGRFKQPETRTIDETTTDRVYSNNHHQGRRHILRSAALVALASITAVSVMETATAAEGLTIYNSGKAPKVPGEKPKDKSDVKGTKKDPAFLRSISDCKSQCENTVGPDGLSKSKEDCLSECQDICCTTYEQCTFAIVPR